MPNTLTIHVTPEELAERRNAIDYALATNGLEGITYSSEELAVIERYASGEIDTEEFERIFRALP